MGEPFDGLKMCNGCGYHFPSAEMEEVDGFWYCKECAE